MLSAISEELENRPKGQVRHRALGKFPVVGMVGGYLGERSALKRRAKAGIRWIASASG